MSLGGFIQSAPRKELGTMLGLTVLAGVANTGLLVVVVGVAEFVSEGEPPDLGAWLWFLGAFATYFFANRSALLRANVMVEELLRDLRLEVADAIRCSELLTIDEMDRSELYTVVSQETNHLSLIFPVLVDCVQQVAMLVTALVYMAYLSASALALFVVTVAAGVGLYMKLGMRLQGTLAQVNEGQARMLERIGDILRGFKEVRLHEARSDSVYQTFAETSRGTQGHLVRFGEDWVSLILIGSFVCFYLLAVVGFLFPRYVDGHSHIVLALMPTILFCMGPVNKLVAVLPMVVRADVGVATIRRILDHLVTAEGATPEEARARATRFQDFQRIEYSGMSFHYRDRHGDRTFSSGPWDLEFGRGEVIFLVGGNGSGKSTALRMMSGLYPPNEGEIQVDGVPLEAADRAGFRELFSAIFMDFHLFDRLYGLEGVDPEEVSALIRDLGLDGKVRFEDGRFTDTRLSTGQRKRLALISALMEDRPLYVFDEWSAEQDHQYREYFYFQILPRLKARGATVLAVTHDDRYWHVADRVLRFELGRVAWEKAGAELAPGSEGD